MIVHCQHCGKEFKVQPWQLRRGAGKFCSRACSDASRRIPAKERFWHYVAKCGPDNCWEWLGCKSPGGYGQFYSSERRNNVGAHRFSYWLHYGIRPKSLFVCHHCDNPGCVNPAHLFLGTPRKNTHDAMQKGRMAFGDRHPAHRHPESRPRGSANPMAKLTESDIVEIRRAYASGNITQEELGERYGVCHSNISLIVRGKHWRHVPLTTAEIDGHRSAPISTQKPS